jgi:hypothetical protein
MALYRASYSDDYVVNRLNEAFDLHLTAVDVAEFLKKQGLVRRDAPPIAPYSHAEIGVAPVLTDEIREMIERMAKAKSAAGDGEAEIQDWYRDQIARYSRVEHICHSEELLFNSREAVAALIRRLKKYHAAIGQPVAGKGFENLLAETWRDLGYSVLVTPPNYDGADAHVEVENQWVAMSMKSESRWKRSSRTIHLSSVAPHDVEINTPADCVLAIEHAVAHLARYERMVYLRTEEDHFPSGYLVPPYEAAPYGHYAQRYTLLELPKNDIAARLGSIETDQFAKYFAEPDEAADRNTFRVRIDDDAGRRLFNVTVSRRPPRVSVTAVDINYCDPIASYWTEPIDGAKGINRELAEAGAYRHTAEPRYDV